VARLAAATGRDAHLLWLQADAEEARRAQYERGRVVPEASFCAHARRAASATAELLGDPPPGWRSVTVLDRSTARGGLRLDTGPAPVRGHSPAQEQLIVAYSAEPGSPSAAALPALQQLDARK
jgi:hypothetical protein